MLKIFKKYLKPNSPPFLGIQLGLTIGIRAWCSNFIFKDLTVLRWNTQQILKMKGFSL